MAGKIRTKKIGTDEIGRPADWGGLAVWIHADPSSQQAVRWDEKCRRFSCGPPVKAFQGGFYLLRDKWKRTKKRIFGFTRAARVKLEETS